MGKFTVIPEDAFDALQLDAGVLLKRFNPANPQAPADADIICATTGGINPTCKPTYSDFGEDVDNVPKNMKEFKHLDGWDCGLATTSLGTSPELIQMALGCADIDENNTGKIIPRMDLKQSDFKDIWWVGDKANGGLVAIQLKNALSSDGFSLQTSKNGKGQVALNIVGHVSINAQKEVPMVFYSLEPSEVTAYRVDQILSHVTSNFEDAYIDSGDNLEITLTADTGYEIANVVVIHNGSDVTATAWNDSTSKITITSVAGDISIMATATIS